MEDVGRETRASSGERALVLGVLLAGLLVRLGLCALPIEAIDRILLVDDSYIAFNVARNLALGRGPLADSVHATSGYQPLYVWTLVPVFAALPGDKELPIRLALVLLAAANAATGGLAYAIVRRYASRWGALATLITWSLWGPVVQIGLNGLETSLALALIAASLWYSLRSLDGRGTPFRLGLILGAAVLARVDAVGWAGLLVLDGIRRPGEPLHARLRRAGSVIAGIVLLVGPWLAGNAIAFGSPLPESGAGTRFQTMIQGSDGALLPYAAWVARNVGRAFASGAVAAYTIAALAAGGALLVPALRRRKAPAADGLAGLLVYPFVLIAFYCTAVGAHWYFYRYLYPVRLCLAVLLGLAVSAAESAVRARLGAAVARPLTISAVASLGLVLALRLPASLRSDIGGYREIGVWARAHLPSGTVVGTTQSGSLAYFADQLTVVNLDGKVNRRALEAMKSRRMIAYARQCGVRYVLDRPFNAQKLVTNRSTEGTLTVRRVIRTGHNGEWVLFDVQ
jgi:Dolichyl-phosphate-mannose-protein mannosyltransferase